MPELPEVETVVRGLRSAKLLGVPIHGVAIAWEKTIATPSVSNFCKDLLGDSFAAFERRGKWILMRLESGRSLALHLRMTGKMLVAGKDTLRHERIRWELEDSRYLVFVDSRKFGRCHLVENEDDVVGKLGPEPLQEGFSGKVIYQRLHGRSKILKAALLDQEVIAGLGNIYVDEALWLSRLHPATKPSSLTEEQCDELRDAIVSVLNTGLANNGTSLGGSEDLNFLSVARKPGKNLSHLQVFRRTGEDCPRCGSSIQRESLAGRSTHFCLHCQPPPRQ